MTDFSFHQGLLDPDTKEHKACPVTQISQGKCPFSGATGTFELRPQEPKYLRLKNWVEGTQAVDTLHQKATNVSELSV